MSAVPSRAEWFGQPSPVDLVESHDAFGWKVHRHQFPVGARMVIVSSRPVTRENSPNRALFVKGRATVIGEDGTKFPDRVAGLWTPERPDQPAGVTTITATAPLEFWCFNYTANRNAFPQLEPVRLAKGKRLDLAAGQHFFLAAGTVNKISGPASITAEAPMRLLAKTPAYGFVMEPRA